MGIKHDIFWRIGIAFLFMVVLSIAIVWRIFQLQSVQGAYWRSQADSLTTKYMSISADRGNIYSADNRILATSLPSFEIRFDTRAEALTDKVFYKEVGPLAEALSNLFKDKSSIDYKNELINARKARERYHLIKRSVSYTELLQLKTFPLFKEGQYKGGFIALQQNKRTYPYRELANRTIGYLRDVTVKPVGLEAMFNDYLTGVVGKRLMQKVSGGEWMPINSENEIEPKNGKDVITTLDVFIQDITENALLKTLIKNNADHGCVIVMDVKTGMIKAIANLGKNESGNYIEKYNYAVGEAHEPGSTFKLASMLALLQDDYIKLSDTVDTEYGRKVFFNQLMQDAEQHPQSRVTVKTCFAISSNVGVSKLVYQNYNKQPEKYLQHLRQLQLDQPVGIEIPGEVTPYIRNTQDKHWSKVSLPWMSVGYELKISPLRLLTLYNAVANNGVMMKPYLVSSIQEYGKPVKEFHPEVLIPKICNDTTLQDLRVLLEGVVVEGTARNIRSKYYTIAGKTGTAQIADNNRGFNKTSYQSSFYGYFPADKPLYSICVVVNNPSNGSYYGSTVAAPVFKEIADNIFATDLDIHPTEDTVVTPLSLPVVKTGFRSDLYTLFRSLQIPFIPSDDGTWLTSVSNNKVIQLADNKIIQREGLVPNVTGMGLRDALFLLESSGLNVTVNGVGTVKSQSLPAGTKFQKGQIITINLNS